MGDVAVKLAGRTSKLKDHLSLASLNFESLCLCGDAFYCAEQSKLVHIGSYVKFKDLTGTVCTYYFSYCNYSVCRLSWFVQVMHT